MKLLFNLLILTLLATGLQCSHREKKKDTAQSGSAKDAPAGPKDIVVDSAQITQYLNWREKKELGPSLSRFYKTRNYSLAWWKDNKLSPVAPMLINHLEHADDEGLPVANYKVAELKKYYNALKDVNRINTDEERNQAVQMDLLLSSEFSKYAIDMKEGVTREQKEKIGWLISESHVRYDSLLNAVLGSDQQDPINMLEPSHPEYAKLKEALKEYRALAAKGGWPQIRGVTKLKLGDTADQVTVLRERLTISGDMKTGATNFFNPKIFDRTVDLGVKNFQTRHGLEPDGVVAANTLEVLNTTVNERIRQILVNMERWRLVPPFQGKEHILVNVPEFRLHIFEGSSETMTMRVIVGKEFKATPVFSDELQNVVFSPYWNLPKSIIAEEILPMMAKDPSYLSRHNMEAMKGFAKDAMPVKAWEVPWYNIDDDNFQYWIRQRPGGDNPLGLVKFLFPNNFNVYLHDTPADALFSQVKRAYSHGCIRVERPADLAAYVLKDQPKWTDEKIQEAMNSEEEQFIRCRPIPVFILYFTSWVDNANKIQFREDIYGLDPVTAQELGV